MRKSVVIGMILIGIVWVVPAASIEQLCSIEPCCAMEQPIDCCTIEEAPAPAPELVLTDMVRIDRPAAVDHVPTVTIQVVIGVTPAPEPAPFAPPPPERLALLSTYLI